MTGLNGIGIVKSTQTQQMVWGLEVKVTAVWRMGYKEESRGYLTGGCCGQQYRQDEVARLGVYKWRFCDVVRFGIYLDDRTERTCIWIGYER